MAKVKAELRCLSNRGETVGTRWGDVTFDTLGYATLEVEDADLPLLRQLGWLQAGVEAAATPVPVASSSPSAATSTSSAAGLPPGAPLSGGGGGGPVPQKVAVKGGKGK